ncbi:MAG: glycoside hydrolase family 28 protein [bacterium]|jgi:polygalacturonase
MKLILILCVFTWLSHPAQTAIVDVRDYGATSGKESNQQAAIQAAIDACAENGGGTVYFPAGEYLSGTISLRDHITLYFEAGATLYASTKPEDYPQERRLLHADGVQNISITGQGTIHGQATADYGARWGAPETPAFRTGILLFENCNNVVIRDINILYSDSWTVHLRRCEDVLIDGIRIFNNIRRLNSDGIDPNSCRNVRISNCHIVAGDDCIVFKATEPYPCEDIVVTNCVLETTTTALKLGTESRGDFRDIRVSNCIIKNTRTGIGFFLKDGATMERVNFSSISIENFNASAGPYQDIYPIFMDIEKRHEDSSTGTIRDVTFRDIDIRSGSGILIQGMPESLIDNLTLQNITLRISWLDDYSKRKKAVGGRRTYRDERDTLFARKPAYVTIAHAQNVLLDNVRVYITEEVYDTEERSAFYGSNLSNLTIRALYGDSHESIHRTPVIILENCSHGVVTDCVANRVSTTFLKLQGEGTRRILVVGNELSRVDLLVKTDDQVHSGEYKIIGNFELRSRFER